ncbi:FAD-dependent monooxygenase [Streptomyces sp. NPDC007905]|uniref:FAD-dependent monooxygenase n=1 Tax=Streptomyces sp. NPDC007905 TaxID=3364788 RepID=UPI0036E54E85
MASRLPVLVVGAGPVGMVVASELLQQQVPVRIIDADRAHSNHSRATSLWPRILEILGRTGVSDELICLGHRVDRVHYYSAGRHLGAARLDRLENTPYPFGLALPQSVTEDVLERRLTELGGKVERGLRLTGLLQDGDTVQARVTLPDGCTEDIEAAWVVGADGSHSAVRDLLGIAFDGPSLRLDFAIGDATIDGRTPEHMVGYCWSPAGNLALAALGERAFRVAVRITEQERQQRYGTEYFERVLHERGPRGSFTVSDVRFSTTFTAAIRSAARYRVGRCFLAGDAAHVMSPAGGQGMNTGIQDGVNLAWKLAGVMTGRFPDALLDSYESERRRAATSVAQGTARQAALGNLTRRGDVLRRDLNIRLGSLTGRLRREVAPTLGQLNVSYSPLGVSSAAGRIAPGDRVPALPGRDLPGWAELDVARFTVLAWESDAPPAEEAVPAGLHRVATRAADAPQLAKALGDTPVLALIRPDGHLAALVDPARPDALADAYAHALGEGGFPEQDPKTEGRKGS